MQLVDIDSIHPSAYNPRESDTLRLKYIELSLKKLGFLLPVYVSSENNEILSGHQRHYVSKQMGLKQIPVEFVPPMSLMRRKGFNIAFNRGTNDISRNETSVSITKKLKTYDVFSMANSLSDTENMFPCLTPVDVNARQLGVKNIDKSDDYCTNLARSLSPICEQMPIVITQDLQVINGIGRLFYQLENGCETVKCIVVSDERKFFASIMLNLLSMDFNIHKKYADDLRFNSFRRVVTKRKGLGLGMIAGVFGKKTKSSDFECLDGVKKSRWIEKYGTNVIDFGAGRLEDTNLLRKAGINVCPFEPYFCQIGSNKIDRPASIEIVRSFLKEIENGKEFSTIFISSVLNSVPFFSDRSNIIALCSALCSDNTLLSIWTMSTNRIQWLAFERNFYNKNDNFKIHFKLDYEEGVFIGNFSKTPKVQKVHTADELLKLTGSFFDDVKVISFSKDYLVECRKPKLNLNKLREAIEFEFDLPYPDGQRMGLVNEAKKSFGKRLGVSL